MQSETVKTKCTQWRKGYKFIRTHSAVAMGTDSLGSNPQSTMCESRGIPSCLCLWSPHSGMPPCFQKKLAPPSLWERVCPPRPAPWSSLSSPSFTFNNSGIPSTSPESQEVILKYVTDGMFHLPTKKTPICWSTKPQRDGIWSWGLCEMIRFRWGCDGAALRMRLMPL